METSFPSLFTVLCLCLLIIVCWLFVCSKRTYEYWKNRGVKYIEPSPYFGDNIYLTFSSLNLINIMNKTYNTYSNERFFGMFYFRRPILVVRDPDLINKILTSDFKYFKDRLPDTHEKPQKLSSHLYDLTGSKWENIRHKLAPLFTHDKLKTLVGEVEACAEELECFLEEKSGGEIEIRDLMLKFQTKVILSVAFGFKLDCLNKSKLNCSKGQQLIRFSFLPLSDFVIGSLSPKLRNIVNVKSMTKDMEDFYLEFIKETVAHREKSNVRRNDFLQLLIDVRKSDADVENENKNSCSHDEMFTDDTLLASNIAVFFETAFATIVSTLSTCLLELAVNLDVQKKLREEIMWITRSNNNNQLTYESLKEMKYMKSVILETLRKYPVHFGLSRICTSKYRIPESDIILDEGIKVVFPIYAIHRDPQYYPHPEVFDPDRFLMESVHFRRKGTYLPFGDGPRMCIGFRFAMLEIKLVLALLIKKFEFRMTKKMVYPLEFNKDSKILIPKDGIWLKIQKI